MLSPEEKDYLHSIWTDPKHAGRKPTLLRVDKGSEFKNKKVMSFLKDKGIHIIFTQNETKSNFAERAIQNIKNRLYRMFTERQSYHFLSELQNIIKSINTPHVH
ncbi:hypothetical protein KUTeg_018729 [Tegillarca granosa]|uniref:Integrase catalytic domain-containing protein n=1 Tax=Tegillarca granosa TaxID=220873 RepID=A0ABQ9EIV7_TEGGR|nr:hypothetical protein KUTeg_018729 [Tegillarca granosa]